MMKRKFFYCVVVLLLLFFVGFAVGIYYFCSNGFDSSFSSCQQKTPLAYEMIIKNKPEWKNTWNAILKECTHPNKPLIQHSHMERHVNIYNECRNFPNLEKWTKFEMESHRPNTNLTGLGPAADNGWQQNNGKFRKSTNSKNITISKEIAEILSPDAADNDIPRPTGHLYYPKGGYKEWHTNKFELPGWRLYIIHTKPDKCSSFRYVDHYSNEIVNSKDRNGMARLFKVNDGISEPVLWHAISSDGDRWSFGFYISERSAKTFRNMCSIEKKQMLAL